MASHGQQALDLIDSGVRPTVILCDVMMPGTGTFLFFTINFYTVSALCSDGWLWFDESSSRKARHQSVCMF